ncbi:EAL domain-containing protein [Shewanella sp. AS16]|uniref:EAL domain-containing protein n=1 Tax=Shewanella sp. AS16 TaxID=2907625 RepID=UPI003FA37EAD
MRTFLYFHVLLSWAFLALYAPAAAAAPVLPSVLKFEHLTSQDGLNQNTITSLFMDKAGMLWAGTQDGLHSYNGNDFQVFLHSSQDPDSISESYVTDIIQDGDGFLWVATLSHGLNRLDLNTGKFQHFDKAQGLNDPRVTKLGVTGDTLWIGTETGLYALSLHNNSIKQLELGNSQTPKITSLANAANTYLLVGTQEDGAFAISSNKITQLGLPQGLAVNQIRATSLYSVWFALKNQLWHYSLETQQAELVWQQTPSATDVANINDFSVSATGVIWAISPGKGLIQIDNAGTHLHVKYHMNAPQRGSSLSDSNMSRLLLDNSGTLWIGGLYSGIDRVSLDKQHFEYFFENNNINPRQNNNIRALFRAANGDLWIGTDGGGLKSLPHDGDDYLHHNALFAKALGLQETELKLIIRDIAQDRQGRLWFASNYGVAVLAPDGDFRLLSLEENSLGRQQDELVRNLEFDAEGRLWVATAKELYVKPADRDEFRQFSFASLPEFDAETNQIIVIRALGSRLWLGTFNGLISLDPDTGAGRMFHQEDDPNLGLSNDRIRDIIQARNGDIWVASHGGLSRLRPQAEGYKFTHYNGAQGLPSDTVYAMLEDRQGDIWLSSNAGISRLSPDGSIITFNELEGLQALEYNGAVAMADDNGDLWFGGIRGINRFNPARIPSHRTATRPTLTGYKIAGHAHRLLDLSRPPVIEMQFDDQVIGFEVGSLDFSYPGQYLFGYRLEGFDSQWHTLHNTSEITYTNLPPGDYTLRVRQGLQYNAPGDEALEVKLKVLAPFYLTKLAYGLYWLTGFALLLGFSLLQRRKRLRQREFETSIRASEERLKLALWASGDGMWDWSISKDQVYRTNMAPLSAYGSGTQTLIDNIYPEDRARVRQALTDHLEGKSAFYEAEYRIEQQPGELIWLLDRGKVVETDGNRQPVRMAGTHKDITSRKLTENELRLSSQVLQSMNEAVVVGDLNFRICSVNPAFSAITGFSQQEVYNQHFLFLALGKRQRQSYLNIERQLLRHKHWAGEIKIRTRNRKSILIWLEINQVIDNKGETSHFVAVFTDITDRKKAEEDLRFLASFDTLTGLPNRTLFQDRLNHAITQAHRAGTIVALFFLDLDRFKHVNDSMGHHVGDMLLKSVALRLQNAIREGDTVARLGGDEFTIILEGINQAKAATVVAEKVLRAFQAPFLLDDNTVTISPSIGISLYPNDADNSAALIKYADTAMYHAKASGRNNFQFYTSSLNEYAVRHVQLEAGLKLAIQRNEFHLVYQPKFNVIDGTLSGLEALLRWESPELGNISPAEFIPLAEETGIITQIGQWAIHHACSQLASWHEQGYTNVAVAVNLSARQLKADIISTIEVALAVSGLAASALELELTESMIMATPQDSVAILTQLKALGLSIAVDDFGTGYSSLSYLKRLPLDTLKIDREFVRDISNDPDDAAITSAIIALAHSLDLKVVAEGVETQEQLNFLAGEGCDQVQGFLFSRPLPASQCLELFKAGKW